MYNTHKRQTSMRPAGFELANPEIERLPNYALYRAATWIRSVYIGPFKIYHVTLTYRNIPHYVPPHMRQCPSCETSSLYTLKPFAFCHPNKTLPQSGVSWPVIKWTLAFTVYPTYILKISHLTSCRLKICRVSLRCPQPTVCQSRQLNYSRAPQEKEMSLNHRS